MNPTRQQIDESVLDLKIALRDELERYLAACRPPIRALDGARARLAYLDWADSIPPHERGADV